MEIEKRKHDLLHELMFVQEDIILLLKKRIKIGDLNNPGTEEAILFNFEEELKTLEEREGEIRDDLSEFPVY